MTTVWLVETTPIGSDALIRAEVFASYNDARGAAHMAWLGGHAAEITGLSDARFAAECFERWSANMKRKP